MCHRFKLTTSPEAVARFLESFSVTILPELLPSKDYYPIYDVLALRMVDDNEWAVEPRSWGFLPRSWKPTDRIRTRKSFQRGKINARSETVDQTWPWKFAFPTQRCVLLASSFYEPSRDGGDGNYTLPGHDMFCMAGLWDHFEGDDGKGNVESIDSCVMLTTDANTLVESTRKGRMRQPVVLTEVADIKRYCSLELTEHSQVANLFTPWPDDQMQYAADSPQSSVG
ncbi:MAG: SOS response-associated peptidase family protein [Fuerstiella sp.]